MLLAIISQLFTTRVGQVIGGTGLSYTQFSILNHLEAQPDTSVSDLAAAMEINQPGVSKVVQRLHESGMVAVRTDPRDSRRKRIRLDDAGRRALGTARTALAEDGDDWFVAWPADKLADFRDQLGELATWLDDNRLANAGDD